MRQTNITINTTITTLLLLIKANKNNRGLKGDVTLQRHLFNKSMLSCK